MRLIFLGTPEFAVPSLIRLHDAGHRILMVLTQPDRPAGRGRKVTSCPVKLEAERRGLSLCQPERLEPTLIESMAALDPEALVVVAYGLILPPALLRVPRLGCVNLHASLLPRYRGAAPVAHVILRGETITGVTTLLMDEGIDTGPILLQREAPIAAAETAGEVEARLSILGADLLVETMAGMEAGKIQPRPQEIDRETYARKIDPAQARIEWDRPAAQVLNLVRAMNPRPGASTVLGEQRVKVWRATVGSVATGTEVEKVPGSVLSTEGFPRVLCGGGTVLELREMQWEGRRRVSGEEAVRGRGFGVGDRFGGRTAKQDGGAGPASARL